MERVSEMINLNVPALLTFAESFSR